MSNFVEPMLPLYATVAGTNGLTTGTSRTQLPNAPARTIFLRSAKTNTTTIYIGDVTVTSAGGGNVFVDLQPGEGIFMDVQNANNLYAVAASATPLLYVSGLR